MSGRHGSGRHRGKGAPDNPLDVFSSPAERRRHRGNRRPPGPRRAALKGKRRSRLRRQGLAGVVAAGLASLLAAGAAVVTVREVIRPDPAPSPTAAASSGALTTMLLFGTKEARGGESGSATWMSLLYYDEVEKTGGVIYVPAHTATEVPGRGLLPVGDALATGGVPLLLVSAENLLGVHIDRYIELSDKDAEVLFQHTGPISVDVPTEVRVKAGPDLTQLLFAEGAQTMDATFLMRYLYTHGLDEDDVELGVRHLTFWDGFWKHFSTRTGLLSRAIAEAGDALSETDAPLDQHARFFEELAALEPSARVIAPLPVTQVSVGKDELYQIPEDELEEFVDQTMGEDTGRAHEIRVQILNGNGVPGIGQDVADKLVGHGFRVILTGNASRLNYKETLIVTYDSSPESLALAEKARTLLGLGEVQVSVQPQGIVDLTIVVGKDFLRQS